MGLTIIAFEKAKLISDNFYAKPEELDHEGEAYRAKVNQHFKSHDHITTGIYAPGGLVMSFEAGSYGTFKGFRLDLCKIAYGEDLALDVWNNPEKYKGGDFYELINFSDSEGVIGPTTAGKLFYDFRKHRDAYHLENNLWDNEKYDDWLKALDLASNDGILIFS